MIIEYFIHYTWLCTAPSIIKCLSRNRVNEVCCPNIITVTCKNCSSTGWNRYSLSFDGLQQVSHKGEQYSKYGWTKPLQTVSRIATRKKQNWMRPKAPIPALTFLQIVSTWQSQLSSLVAPLCTVCVRKKRRKFGKWLKPLDQII